MSRILKVMVVLLAITAMVAPTVFAEDRLSLNGQLRVRGFVKDNGAPNDFNDNAAAQTEYFDQRLRLGGTLAVAEGVAVKFRYDLWDSQWGGSSNTNSNGLNDADNQAYMVITKDMFTFKAGDQAHALGNAIAIDTIGTGAVLDINAGAATVQLAGFKMSEGAAGDDDDTDLYTVAVMHKTDLYNGSVFAGYMRSGGTDAVAAVAADATADPIVVGSAAVAAVDAYEIYLLGAAADFNLDAAKVKFELNYFDGEDETTGGDDYKGLQAYVDASMAVSDMATVGGILTYAKGYDGANEEQITDLSDDASFLPETYGFMQILYSVYPGGASSTFDPTGDSRGVIGVQGYTSLKLSDDLSLRASIAYATPEEDAAAGSTKDWEDFITYVGSARYKVAANTNLDTVLSYTTVDAGNATTPDDAQLIAGFRLAVNF